MSLSGKTIYFTGTLSTPRAEATKSAESAGATVAGSVTKKVDILVAGPGAGAKADKAAAMGVEVWTEEQFTAALSGKKPSGKSKAAAAPKAEPAAKRGKKSAPPPAAPAAFGGGFAFGSSSGGFAFGSSSTPKPDDFTKPKVIAAADGVPVVSLGLFAQVKDCGDEGTTFPSANGISSGAEGRITFQ